MARHGGGREAGPGEAPGSRGSGRGGGVGAPGGAAGPGRVVGSFSVMVAALHDDERIGFDAIY